MTIKKLVIGAVLAVSATIFMGANDPIIKKPPVEVTYIVKSGDTLWSIASEFVGKNTYASRDVQEFKSGIEQLNPWLKTPERQYGGLVLPGDELIIHYWIKE